MDNHRNIRNNHTFHSLTVHTAGARKPRECQRSAPTGSKAAVHKNMAESAGLRPDPIRGSFHGSPQG